MWSLGVILHEMLYGKTPFVGNTIYSLCEDIKRKLYPRKKINFPSYPPISPIIKDLISRVLMWDENDRISWDEFFAHPMLKVRVNTLFNKNLG